MVASSGRRRQRLCTGLARADPYRPLEVVHENLPVPNLARPGNIRNAINHLLQQVVVDGQLDLHLGQKVDDVLCPTVKLSVALLAPETLDLRHSYSLHPEVGQGLPHVVELEGLDDGADHFHGRVPRHRGVPGVYHRRLPPRRMT